MLNEVRGAFFSRSFIDQVLGETHFKITVVSTVFSGKPLVQRHRLVYGILEEEIKQGVHALSINAWTEEEWERKREKFEKEQEV